MNLHKAINHILTSIYANNSLNQFLFLKGGQALRMKELIHSRFSSDIDFSTPESIKEMEFFSLMEDALKETFSLEGFYLFDFKATKKPKVLKSQKDFWSGWSVEFKLIEKSKSGLSNEQQRREAIVPEGTNSSKFKIDISEHEYCESSASLRINDVIIICYSRAALLTEKIRAICQQHPNYPLKGSDQRARDFYDIERIWTNALKESSEGELIEGCVKIISPIFLAKEVSLTLLTQIFDNNFLDIQMRGWPSVEATVNHPLQPFDYYVETLKYIVHLIQSSDIYRSLKISNS